MQLKDRTDQPRGTWEEVYRNAKRADRSRNDLRERDDGELERTGQPLCIYEPYFGEGTWPFLHSTTLYRGLGLVSHLDFKLLAISLWLAWQVMSGSIKLFVFSLVLFIVSSHTMNHM